MRFTQSKFDNTVFYSKAKDIIFAILFIHVDNITIIGKTIQIIQSIKNDIR